MKRNFTEESLDIVQDEFLLVMLTSQRARDINMGEKPLVYEHESHSKYNDKKTVIALHEIADKKLETTHLIHQIESHILEDNMKPNIRDKKFGQDKNQDKNMLLTKETIEDSVKVQVYEKNI